MSTPSDSRIDQLGAALGQPVASPAARTARPVRAAGTPTASPTATPSQTAGSQTAGAQPAKTPSTGTGAPGANAGSTNAGSTNDEGDGADGDARTPEPERPMPPSVKRMPALLQELWKKGVQFSLDSRTGDFLVEGFYTNGALRLSEQDDGMQAVDKRGRKEHVVSFDDLARINFRWWRLSTDKDRYIAPQRPWIDAFTQNKWVTRKVIFVPADDTGDNNLPV